MKVILASKNQHKLTELSAILSGLGFEIALESEYGLDIDVDETGTTFEENSLLKAEAVMKASGLPVLADDSGLMVDSLDGAPGVYSARYGHKNSDAERIDYLLANLKDVPAGSRAAKFVCVITCLWPDGRKIVARGECPGEILFAPQGTGGFGYDPVFFVPSLRKTFAQMTAEEKNAISHRGNALRAFAVKLKEYLEKHCSPEEVQITNFYRTHIIDGHFNLETNKSTKKTSIVFNGSDLTDFKKEIVDISNTVCNYFFSQAFKESPILLNSQLNRDAIEHNLKQNVYNLGDALLLSLLYFDPTSQEFKKCELDTCSNYFIASKNNTKKIYCCRAHARTAATKKFRELN